MRRRENLCSLQCSLLELNETRGKQAREFSAKDFPWTISLLIVFSSWKIVTTIKVYGKIRSDSFSGNYTPCARRAKQVFTHCTCLRLHGCHQDYAETKLHSELMKFIEV